MTPEPEERTAEYARLIVEATAAIRLQLDQVRLPLHILLDAQFGALNENQEEMLAAAHAAAETIEAELRRLQDIAALDGGTLAIRQDPVAVAELVRALRPQLEADAMKQNVRLTVDIAPGLPRVTGDRARLQEVLEWLLRGAVRRSTAGVMVAVTLEKEGTGVVLRIAPVTAGIAGLDFAYTQRVVTAHGGELVWREGAVVLRLGGG